MSEYRGRLRNELQDEDYRYAYDEEFANSRMATQIKVIREQRDNMTQAELAEKSGMKQSRISALENVDYSAWSISTLRRLAKALGVRLTFKFESWGELLSEVESFSRDALQRPDFEHDSAFAPATVRELPERVSEGIEIFARLSADKPKLENVFRLIGGHSHVANEEVWTGQIAAAKTAQPGHDSAGKTQKRMRPLTNQEAMAQLEG